VHLDKLVHKYTHICQRDEAKVFFLGVKGSWRHADGKTLGMQNGGADDEKNNH
jgi:hypothetical protein